MREFRGRLEERVGHRAADQQPIDFGEEVLDDLELVGDFRAAEDRHERPLRRFEHVAEIFQLLLHEQAGRGVRQQARDGVHGRVRAMRGAERVVHMQRSASAASGGPLRRPGRFFLLRDESAGSRAARHGLPACAVRMAFAAADRRCSRRRTSRAGQAVPRGDRPPAEGLNSGFGLPFGRPRWLARIHRGAVVERVLDGRQRCPDTRVVANHAALERHVEVDADEDARWPLSDRSLIDSFAMECLIQLLN